MIGSIPSHTGSLAIRRIAPAFLLAAVLTVTPAAPVVANTGVFTGAPINLDIADADLKDVLEVFAKVTDFVFVVDAQTVGMGGLDQVVTVNYELVAWDRVLDEILIDAGLEWTLEGKVLWIHLPARAPTGDRNFTGDAITLRLRDAELADVFETLSKVTGLNMEFDSEVEGTITVSLPEIPWDQVLDVILRISGYEYVQEGEVLNVFKTSDSKGMQLISTSGS
jgi:type II secretory pathway component HofQ